MKGKGRQGGVRLNGRRIWSDMVQDDDNRGPTLGLKEMGKKR